ncbi:MAG: hypothetical protein ACRD0P_29540, partial [Stackebrandtia sp.]
MTVMQIVGIVAGAGAIGGVLAALLSEDRGFLLPARVPGTNGTVVRLGFVGLIVIGAIAAALSFALYGPMSGVALVGSQAVTDGAELTLGVLGGAVLVGAGGSKWISSQVDKVVLQRTAAVAAGREADPNKAAEIAAATPSAALQVALGLQPDQDQAAAAGAAKPDGPGPN